MLACRHLPSRSPAGQGQSFFHLTALFSRAPLTARMLKGGRRCLLALYSNPMGVVLYILCPRFIPDSHIRSRVVGVSQNCSQ